jgi:hypothetical protein
VGSKVEPEITPDYLFDIIRSTFANLAAPTAGQFRTFLLEKKGIDVEYNRARVAVERLKRVRSRKEGTAPVISKQKTARHSRTHGK